MAAAAAETWPALAGPRPRCFLLLLVSSAAKYEHRRAAIRATYLRALRERLPCGLSAEDASMITFRFLLGRSANASEEAALDVEAAKYGDILRVSVYDCYDNLFPKLITGYRWAEHHLDCGYVAHADDDSFVRLERLYDELRRGGFPTRGLYYGYFWNHPSSAHLAGGGSRTRPIRDAAAKSYVPIEQWADEAFPAFASGCCFVLSADLVRDVFVRRAPLRPPDPQALRFIRVFDVPVGVALADHPGLVRVHAERIRPYRPLPLFQPDSTVQHYMRPEEFRAFFQKAYASPVARLGSGLEQRAEAGQPSAQPGVAGGSARQSRSDAQQSVGEEHAVSAVYRAFVASGVLRR